MAARRAEVLSAAESRQTTSHRGTGGTAGTPLSEAAGTASDAAVQADVDGQRDHARGDSADPRIRERRALETRGNDSFVHEGRAVEACGP